jgi:hypothetical protein
MPLRNIFLPLSRPRHTVRRALRPIASVLTLGVAGVAVACADAPTGPSPAGAPALATSTSTSTSTAGSSVDVLKWSQPVTQATVTATIGAAGGTLTMPNGATLTVPRGAVSTSTTFGITRLPGRVVAYDFQPHGRSFAVPVAIRQPAAGTNMAQVSASALQGAYFPQTTSLNQTYGTATVTEFRPTTVASDRSSVTFTAAHFSGYLIATGRR